MSDNKYYYAVVYREDGFIAAICYSKEEATLRWNERRFEVIPIPADELNQLIKKYQKK